MDGNIARTRTHFQFHCPLTCRVRSKWPVVAALSGRAASAAKEITKAKNLSDFISSSKFKESYLLQDHLLAFIQAGKKFSLGAVGNSHRHRQFLASILCGGIRDLHLSFAIFFINKKWKRG